MWPQLRLSVPPRLPHEYILVAMALRAAVFVAAVVLCAGSAAAVCTDDGAPKCLLTQETCAKPQPSLTQCYKYNQQSCCVAGHDHVIKSEYDNMWSSTCVREYPQLELLFCLGCNDEQASYVNTTSKEVRVCRIFAESLFNPDESTRTLYDNCGILVGSDVLLPGVAKKEDGSDLFSNAEEFINYKDASENYPLRPPFFKDYTFKVVAEDVDCFIPSSATRLAASVLVVVTLLLSVILA